MRRIRNMVPAEGVADIVGSKEADEVEARGGESSSSSWIIAKGSMYLTGLSWLWVIESRHIGHRTHLRLSEVLR